MKYKFSWGAFIYTIICNIPVVFFLCITSTIVALTEFEGGNMIIKFSEWGWIGFAVNYALSFVLAMVVGNFVPLVKIGRWFTGLFNIDHTTYTGNVPYRLLSTLIITLVYYIVITPSCTILNILVFSVPVDRALLAMGISAPIMILVGFTSSLISDIFAFKVGHAIDPNL